MRRRLVVAATIGIAILVLAVVVAVWSLDSIVKAAIERYGSAATKTAVRVDSVHLSLLDGKGAISGLRVANPPGFSLAEAVSIGEIQLALERDTVRSNPIVVDEISIVGPQVLFEINQAGESNIDVIRRTLSQYRSGGGANVPPVGTEAKPTGAMVGATGEAQRFVIKRLSIREARVFIDAEALGGGEHMKMRLPDTEEIDIGAGGGGATGPEVAIVVVRALIRDVATTVAAAKVQRSIEKGIGGEPGKAVGEGVGEAVKGAGRAFNKLFGEHGD